MSIPKVPKAPGLYCFAGFPNKLVADFELVGFYVHPSVASSFYSDSKMFNHASFIFSFLSRFDM